MQNILCIYCKIYIAYIAKYMLHTLQNIHMYCIHCTWCTLHECFADLYKRQRGKEAGRCLIVHSQLSGSRILPSTGRARVWTIAVVVRFFCHRENYAASPSSPSPPSPLLPGCNNCSTGFQHSFRALISHPNDAGDLHGDARCDGQWWERVQLHLLPLLWPKHRQGIHPSPISHPSMYFKRFTDKRAALAVTQTQMENKRRSSWSLRWYEWWNQIRIVLQGKSVSEK